MLASSDTYAILFLCKTALLYISATYFCSSEAILINPHSMGGFSTEKNKISVIKWWISTQGGVPSNFLSWQLIVSISKNLFQKAKKDCLLTFDSSHSFPLFSNSSTKRNFQPPMKTECAVEKVWLTCYSWATLPSRIRPIRIIHQCRDITREREY